jgi:hypothetical protein
MKKFLVACALALTVIGGAVTVSAISSTPVFACDNCG